MKLGCSVAPRWVSLEELYSIQLLGLVGSSKLLYLTEHGGRGSRRRPLSPHHQPRNLSCGCPRRHVILFFL